MVSPMIWVKVDYEVVENLYEATSGFMQRRIASELAHAAMFHVTMVEKAVPEVMKDKIQVSINDAGDAFVVRYQPKAGTEAPTGTHETTFIPTISATTPVGPVKEAEPWEPDMGLYRSGAEGYFFAGLKGLGRPSLESHIMRTIETIVPDVNEETADFLAIKVKENIRIWFEQHGIKFNEAAGRWQAPASGIALPWGGYAGPSSFIVGEF